MSKTFRPWDVDQTWLLPATVREFVPPGHLAHFVRDTVREVLDLSAIIGVYKGEQGQPPYHPGMLVALLLYGYSRIMPSGGGFIAGYNAQIAVDAAHQIIVAQRLATNPADYAALLPLVDQARANLGRKLREVSGDSGFATEANLAGLAERKVRQYLSPGRIRHGETDPTAGRVLKRKPRMQAMADKIRRAGRRSRYRLRKQVVEPVFGQIKQARGFRQFLLRGLTKVTGEWAMLCTAHNILKLHRAAP